MDFGHVSNTEQIFFLLATMLGFPGGASGKETSYHAGDIRDVGSIPGSGRSPGNGNGKRTLQDPWLKNPIDRGAWWATVHGVAKGQT